MHPTYPCLIIRRRERTGGKGVYNLQSPVNFTAIKDPDPQPDNDPETQTDDIVHPQPDNELEPQLDNLEPRLDNLMEPQSEELPDKMPMPPKILPKLTQVCLIIYLNFTDSSIILIGCILSDIRLILSLCICTFAITMWFKHRYIEF